MPRHLADSRWFTILFTCGVVLVAVVILASIPIRYRDDAIAKAQLLQLRSQMKLGDRHRDVLRKWNGTPRPRLKLHTSSHTLWTIETPFQFGSGNWNLVLEFNLKRLTAIKVRTADDLRFKPAGAPPDLLSAAQ